jgi:transcriptional regulator with XRE-family HTH domain
MNQTETTELEELIAALAAVRVGPDPKKPRFTQKDVAQQLKIGQPAISEFERVVATPRVDTVLRYAKAVGATVTFTITDNNPDEENGTEQ